MTLAKLSRSGTLALGISAMTMLAALPPAAARAPLLDDRRGVLTLAPVLEKVTPAVVNIAVMTRVTVEENPLLKDPFFRKFFWPARHGKGAATEACAGGRIRRRHRRRQGARGYEPPRCQRRRAHRGHRQGWPPT